jgi:putative heme-binding domain-containing protein
MPGVRLFSLPVLLAAWPLFCAAQERDLRQPAAIAQGQKLYDAACSACHGKTGEGGRGPNLSDGVLIRRSRDDRLFSSIRNGVPGSDMPPFPLPPDQIWSIVAYLRSLSAPAMSAPLTGDPETGKALYFGAARCAECHAIRGSGGALGPDLSDAGATRTLKQLRESILDPNARLADGFTGVTAVTRHGARLEGVARNYDNHSLQLLDRSGRIHLLSMDEIETLSFASDSLMPAPRLSSRELGDLLAFLSKQSMRAEPVVPTRRR